MKRQRKVHDIMNIILKLAVASILGTALIAPGMANDAHHASVPASAQPVDDASLTEGEIRKIDRSAGKLTIKHGELKNVGMPPMTMVFRVRDTAMLEQVQPGDKVLFAVEKINGILTVTRLESVK